MAGDADEEQPTPRTLKLTIRLVDNGYVLMYGGMSMSEVFCPTLTDVKEVIGYRIGEHAEIYKWLEEPAEPG